MLRPFLISLSGGLGMAIALLGSPSHLDAEAQTKPGAATDTGLVTIESDLQKADNKTGIITATGNVRIIYPDRKMEATSRQAQYFSKEGRLVLSGDVDVVDADGQRLQAETVTYRLDRERLLAEPNSGQQVVSRFKLPVSQPDTDFVDTGNGSDPLLP